MYAEPNLSMNERVSSGEGSFPDELQRIHHANIAWLVWNEEQLRSAIELAHSQSFIELSRDSAAAIECISTSSGATSAAVELQRVHHANIAWLMWNEEQLRSAIELAHSRSLGLVAFDAISQDLHAAQLVASVLVPKMEALRPALLATLQSIRESSDRLCLLETEFAALGAERDVKRSRLAELDRLLVDAEPILLECATLKSLDRANRERLAVDNHRRDVLLRSFESRVRSTTY